MEERLFYKKIILFTTVYMLYDNASIQRSVRAKNFCNAVQKTYIEHRWWKSCKRYTCMLKLVDFLNINSVLIKQSIKRLTNIIWSTSSFRWLNFVMKKKLFHLCSLSNQLVYARRQVPPMALGKGHNFLQRA